MKAESASICLLAQRCDDPHPRRQQKGDGILSCSQCGGACWVSQESQRRIAEGVPLWCLNCRAANPERDVILVRQTGGGD